MQSTDPLWPAEGSMTLNWRKVIVICDYHGLSSSRHRFIFFRYPFQIPTCFVVFLTLRCNAEVHPDRLFSTPLPIYPSLTKLLSRSQWPRRLRRGSTAARLLGLWLRIPPGGTDVCCECCVLSGRGLRDGLITRPEESYRLWCVGVWSRNLVNAEALAH
jgi:hypothetical protein